MIAHCRVIHGAAILAIAGSVVAGASGATVAGGPDHWAFRRIVRPAVPGVKHAEFARTPVDAFLLSALERKNLTLGPSADRATLLRRLTFDLIGLPPRPEEIAQFVADRVPDAYPRAVERLLASPHYGERWGKYWLDVVGYADSNGYFNADSDRPLAYRYRDYVIRAFNEDKPFDQFVREQLAGDELSGYVPQTATNGQEITPRIFELFTATHYLRNGQDGTSESDGNPDERRVDRATALQSALQITMNALLGVTIQCARCHDHKFEPIEQADYYRLQSIFYPAFPAYDPERWVKPIERFRDLPLRTELAAWEGRARELEAQASAARRAFAVWIDANRPPEAVLFRDDFRAPERVNDHWSNTAPGDDGPGGVPPVALDSSAAPGAIIQKGTLALIESGAAGDRWLVTKQAFDWKPQREGEWIQASFELVADRIGRGPAAARIGYFIAAHDFNDNSGKAGGNILIDGNPGGGAAVHVDYPGAGARVAGEIGNSGYRPGHRYGVRVTNVGGRKFRIEHVVDLIAEKKAITLDANDLPNGAFGFEFCCGRSFIVDNVIVETSGPQDGAPPAAAGYRKKYQRRERELLKTLARVEAAQQAKPGRIACVTDLLQNPPPVRVLKRGNYADPGEAVVPAGLSVLCDGSRELPVSVPFRGAASSGRRLAFARWLTDPNSRASALVARVLVNRIWQRHFSVGIVATPDNFGVSGAAPTHRELLDFLADEFRKSGWSIKSIHRLILLSAAYRQSSAARAEALAADPTDRLLWRYPLARLDAEAVRDAMLAISGELSERLYGPYVPTTRQEDGSVVVREIERGAMRRGIYLQQRRTQVNTLLELFDAPVMVNNCAVRGTSTVPLQSLALLNSAFVRDRATAFSCRRRRASASGHAPDDVRRTLVAAFGREPTDAEQSASVEFLKTQAETSGQTKRASDQAWNDFCQMLLASNAFLYIE